MTLIRIQERPNGPNGANAIVNFNNGPEYPITISDPFSEEEEKLLEWYFEEHLQFPFLEQVKAQQVAASIITYGEKLFQQIVGDQPKAYLAYMNARQQGVNTLQLEIAGSPKFHSLHWESLKDPELQYPLALQATMVRKNLQDQIMPASVQPSPTINLLVITARPFGKGDVGYRTISQPLVETLRKAKLPVKVDILRPGTYEALENHLQEISNEHGVGYYHVIHFDVHGAVLTYEEFQELQKEQKGNHYLYNSRFGRPDIEKYEGVKAFLFLDGGQNNQADLVEAQELANLLLSHQIPIAILNACQSGKQMGASETSLGSRLMQAGVQLVLAMGYSVTVTAAQLLMSTLYRQLFANANLSFAISRARSELYNRKARKVYFDQLLDLEDWLLPVVYQNQPQQLAVRQFTPEESKAHFEALAQAARYTPPEPQYGFVGRDLDILQLEKRLLTQRNIVLVRGMGGAGKTTLLHHLSSWWRTTGFVQQIFYFGYDEQAYNRQQIMVAIAQRLLTQVQYLTDFQPLSLDAQQAMLTQLLRAHPHLLILDNLESITGSAMAIQNTLPKPEQDALQRFLADLAGGRTLVLLGSRSSEAWLAKGTFEDNIYDLDGLDPEAASTLADRILEKHKVTKYRKDNDLQTLLKLLNGFPLALEVVLPNLTRQTPSEVLTALQAGDVSLDDKHDSQKKTESIIRCIDYSHSNLSPDAQALLLCLAPFTSVLDAGALNNYTNHLKEQPVLASLPFDRWQGVLQEAMDWGLLSPDPDIPRFLRLQPVLPYFLRNRLNVPDQREMRSAIETAFRKHYDQVGDALYKLLKSKDPQERRVGKVLTYMEYENLIAALNIALREHVSVLHIFRILSGYLTAISNASRGLELSQTVLNRLEDYLSENSVTSLDSDLCIVIDSIAMWQLFLKNYTAADSSYRRELSLWLENKHDEAATIKWWQAYVYRQLGVIAEEQLQWVSAEYHYQQALQIFIELDNRYEQARTYHNLGVMFQKWQQPNQANQYYQHALRIKKEINALHSQAATYGQLGMLAQEQRQWVQAEEYYQQALQIFMKFNDRYEQAGTYLNLGIVAQQQSQWKYAEECYQLALRIFIELNNLYKQAQIYHNLGVVAQNQQQRTQAEQYYRRALQLKRESNDLYSQASTYGQLGKLAQEEQQLEQSRDYFLQGLEIFVAYEDSPGIGLTLYNLAQLWQRNGDKSILDAVTFLLNMSHSEVVELFNKMLVNRPDELES